MTGTSPHHLNYIRPFMRGCGIANFIDGLNGRLYGGIEPDVCVARTDIVVDGTRNTDGFDTEMVKFLRTPKTSVTSEYNETFDAEFLQALVSAALSILSQKLKAPSRIQTSPATLYDITYGLDGHRFHITVEKSRIATADTYDFKSVINGCSDDCAHTRVHARRVATARQDSNLLDDDHPHRDPKRPVMTKSVPLRLLSDGRIHHDYKMMRLYSTW